ncbi:hypothetical protein [Clostridium sp. D33t1_170424_F3]|uniref:hypothetical protein n=1 Tax=Clostridium sp. D33t1_170424_F3 TaxID=2787099 RepID=UPI0018A99F83|nr:hypothetical protein [Clostridium sp. D33t1_170424_F3]
MPWGEIGAVLAVLIVVFIAGKVWFHLVEGVLGGIKRLFQKRKPEVWHALPPEKDTEEGNKHV